MLVREVEECWIEDLPSNVPSTTAVVEKCGAGFCTRALVVYAGKAMVDAFDLPRDNAIRFGSPTQAVVL